MVLLLQLPLLPLQQLLLLLSGVSPLSEHCLMAAQPLWWSLPLQVPLLLPLLLLLNQRLPLSAECAACWLPATGQQG